MPYEFSVQPKAADFLFVIYDLYKDPSRDFERAMEAFETDEEKRLDLIVGLRAAGSDLYFKRYFSYLDPDVFEAPGTPYSLSPMKNLGVVRMKRQLNPDEVFNPDIPDIMALIGLAHHEELTAMAACPEYDGIFKKPKQHSGLQKDDLDFLRLLYGELK